MHLPDFFHALDAHPDRVPLDTLVKLLERLAITRADVEPVLIFDDEQYRRNLLRVGPGYAALVLCWRAGQATPIHDHHGSACGVRVLEGHLAETRYRRDAAGMLHEGQRHAYGPGQVCGSYDADIHVIRNDQPAGCDLITLHVYTPPLREYHVYALDSAEVRTCVDRETQAALTA